MKEKLEQIKTLAISEICTAENTKQIEELRVKFLGKKGELTNILKQMGSLTAEERPIIGQVANAVRSDIENALSEKKSLLEENEKNAQIEKEYIDITMSGKKPNIGHLHPLTIVSDEIKEIFLGMGFSVSQGSEVEFDEYNFTKLNLPENHPARDTQDTFYITEKILLRTQTSSVQVHVMEEEVAKAKAENRELSPIRIISPGRVYRSDAVDATHSPLFHQIEGLVVDKGVTMADLKGTLETLMQKLYGADCKIRLRPHHFPFTEPSAEVDVMCFKCKGTGCSMCKQEGYIELLGAGMVHPKVLQGCGIDPEIYSGFAFGLGLERIVMRRYGITDMRLLYENDVRFLKQF
ncbi:phenylalanine--tRNA ligase alpha subunit [Clostridia bacterium]|nr:phenylalanine--tRNA ligase alpha subunit [Clostridia bacterium]